MEQRQCIILSWSVASQRSPTESIPTTNTQEDGLKRSGPLIRDDPQIYQPIIDATSPVAYKATLKYIILASPRTVTESQRETGAWNRLKRHHERESLIRNAPDRQLFPPRKSRYPANRRGESFIQNPPHLDESSIDAELLQRQQEIERTKPVRITKQHHQHRFIPVYCASPSSERFISPSTYTLHNTHPDSLLQQPIYDKEKRFTSLTKSSASKHIFPTKSTKRSTNVTKNSRNTGSCKFESNDCERERRIGQLTSGNISHQKLLFHRTSSLTFVNRILTPNLFYLYRRTIIQKQVKR